MSAITINTDRGKKLFKCILKNRLIRESLSNMSILNTILDNYLDFHSYDRGENLFSVVEDKLKITGIDSNRNLNLMISKLSLDDIDIKRILFSRISTEVGTKDGSSLITLFLNEKIGVPYLNMVVSLLESVSSKITCLIIAKSFNINFKKGIYELQNTTNHHIITYEDDYFIDLKNHSLSPLNITIYRGEDQNKLSVKKDELPKLLLSDPFSKYHMLQKDDIVEIERETGIKDSLLDTTINYRHVTLINVDIDSIYNDIE